MKGLFGRPGFASPVTLPVAASGLLLVVVLDLLLLELDMGFRGTVFVLTGLATLLIFIVAPYRALLALIVIKPLLDALWDTSFGGFKALYIIGGLAPLLWLTALLYFRVPIQRLKAFNPMLVFLGIVLLNMAVQMFPNHDIHGGFEYTLRILNGVGFYALVPFFVRSSRERERFINIWLLSTAVPLLFALFTVVTGWDGGFQQTAGISRLKGPYHDATALTFELLPGVILGLYRYVSASGWRKLLWLGYLALVGYFTFASQTRSVWVAFAVVVVYYAVVYRAWAPALAGLLLAAAKWRVILSRFTTHAVDIQDEYGFGGRAFLWTEIWDKFKEYNWLEKLMGSTYQGWDISWYAHNIYLLILTKYGILGLLSFLWVVGYQLFYSLMSVIRAKGERRQLSLIALSVISSILIVGMTGLPLMVPNLQWFFWSFAGLAVEWEFSQSLAQTDRDLLRKENAPPPERKPPAADPDKGA